MSNFVALITPGALSTADAAALQPLLSGVTLSTAGSIRAAVRALDKLAADDPSALGLVAIALEDLGKEPGSIQYRLALHQQQGRTVLIATYHGSQTPPTLVYPFRIDVLTRPPLKPDELAHHVRDEIKKYQDRIARARAGQVLSGIDVPLMVSDREGVITWTNAPASDLFGTGQQLTGQRLTTLLGLDPSSRPAHRLEQLIGTLRPDVTVELGEFSIPHGSSQRTRFYCTARRAQAMESDEIVVALRDITAQHEEHAEYRLSAKVFEHSGEAIMITDHDDRILKVNGGFTQLTGYGAQEVAGRLPTFLNAGKEPALFFTELWDQVHLEGHWSGELWHRRKSGEPYAAWCAISAVRDSDGEVDHYISIFTDVTERRMRDEHRLYQSQLDLLTGLPNRVLLADRFAQIVARHSRQSRAIALLFIDLDGFKPINDNHGHHVGDELLRVVAERLTKSVRASDTVSRYGGDEFVCLLDDLVETEAAQKVAVTILAALGAAITVAGNTFQISASIGVAVFRGEKPILATMMARADDAMYQAKRAGRGRWQLAPEDGSLVDVPRK